MTDIPARPIQSSRLSRLVVAGLAVVGLTLTGVLSAAPAQAAIVQQCTGSIQKVHTIDGYGRVEVWYSPKNGGTNCVMVYDLLPGAHYMQARIRIPNSAKDVSDVGTYEYYAGGAQISGTDGKCIEIDAFIRVSGAYSFRYGHWGPYLCD